MTEHLSPTAELLQRNERKRPRPPRAVLAALGLAALIAVGGVGFAAGRITAPAGTGRFAGLGQGGAGTFFGRGAGGGNGGANGGGAGGGLFAGGGGPALQGTVESINGDTMTLQAANGTTITVNLSTTTTYAQEQPATQSAIGTGDTVRVTFAFTGGAFRGNQVDASSVTVVPTPSS
jgi:hypothetical protein